MAYRNPELWYIPTQDSNEDIRNDQIKRVRLEFNRSNEKWAINAYTSGSAYVNMAEYKDEAQARQVKSSFVNCLNAGEPARVKFPPCEVAERGGEGDV